MIFLLKVEQNSGILDLLGLAISVITLFATIIIPYQIMKFQRYTALMSSYMSYDFAAAILGIINFFHDDCGCDVNKIPEEYKKRFDYDFKKNKCEAQNNLHYQRRLLNDYFMELEMCRESSWILDYRIRREWTLNEAFVVKILVYMNEAVENDSEMFKDISSIKHEKMPKVKGQSEYLEKFYNVMKSSSRRMKV